MATTNKFFKLEKEKWHATYYRPYRKLWRTYLEYIAAHQYDKVAMEQTKLSFLRVNFSYWIRIKLVKI